MCEVLIAHSSEGREWAEYLLQILTRSCSFQEDSIILYDVKEEIWRTKTELFASSKCIILLLTTVFADVWDTPEELDSFWKLLEPPHRVVAFLCGVSEEQVSAGCFEHWQHWRKINSEDEPALYVSTVLECIYEGSVKKHWCETPYEIEVEDQMQENSKALILSVEQDLHQKDGDFYEDDNGVSSSQQSLIVDKDQISIIVQPERIQCGSHVNVYIMLLHETMDEGSIEVEFQCQKSTLQRVPGSLLTPSIVTVQSPDLPSGKASLTIYKNQREMCSTTVTYYTEMEEVSRYLQKVVDPMQFMCQAFDITSETPESLDNLLSSAFEERIPLKCLEVFGNGQIAHNSSADPYDVELPTLLHFSAKYGLRKLTSLLMRCPGALQAYSVRNRDGDYPNQLAEKSGFSDLRGFMDEYVETIDFVKSHMEASQNLPEVEDVYEDMLSASQDFISSFENEDIYECMMKMNPEMDLDESALEDPNPETMLRKFFEAQPSKSFPSSKLSSTDDRLPHMEGEYYEEPGVKVDIYGHFEEDLYKSCCPDEIYDIVETHSCSEVINRPPAPIPRPANPPELEENTTYISKVFSVKQPSYSVTQQPERSSSLAPLRPVRDRDMSSNHDLFAGMKTPGQRQLISLQERVKVGGLTVEEAVQEFKGWQLDQNKRLRSVRYQKENLQKLRSSILRRCKDKGTTELDITAPLQTSIPCRSQMNVTCEVYEFTPRSSAPPLSANRSLQRRSWQSGSTSSSSSTGSCSRKASIHSTVSNTSGVDGDYEDPPDIQFPPHPARPTVDIPPVLPPPRVPPRVQERTPEVSNDRYISNPMLALPQTPPQRTIPPPPIPRRNW